MRSVLITGAGAGIGRALALYLAGRGWRVLAGVRDLQRAQRDFGERAGEVEFIELDVTRPEHVARIAQRLNNEGLDVLVNNAGYGLYGAFEDLSDEQFRAQFETNFFGVLALCRAVLPIMRRAGGGSILNVSSILGRVTLPTGTAYVSSKWALEGFSEALRAEAAPHNVYVSLIQPGLIRTNFKQNMNLGAKVHTAEQQTDDSPYAFLNAKIDRKYEGFSTSAEQAARTIGRIVEKRRPAGRYRVGLDSRFIYALRGWLPDALLDFLMLRVTRSMRRAYERQAA